MTTDQNSPRIKAAEERIGAALIRIEQAAANQATKLAAAREAASDAADLVERVAQLEAANAALKAERDAMTDQAAQEQALMGEGADEMGALKVQISTLTNELTRKTQQLNDMGTELSRLKRHRSEALTDVEALISKVETIAEQVNG